MSKLVKITDSVPVRLFLDVPKKMGPIPPTWLTETQIWLILADMKPPIHVYAINPNNTSEQILLTKENYLKTNEELFGDTRIVYNESNGSSTETDVVETVEEIADDAAETIVEEQVVEETVDSNEVIDDQPVFEDEQPVVETVEEVVEDNTEDAVETIVEEQVVEDINEEVETIDDSNIVEEDNNDDATYSKKKKKHR